MSSLGAPATSTDVKMDQESLLNELANAIESASQNVQEPVVQPSNENLPDFGRTEVKVNECPTCVADSFKWEHKK